MYEAERVVIATQEDILEIASRRCAEEERRRLYVHLASENAHAWVVRDEGTAIAFAFARAYEDEWFVGDLFVEPSFRASGIGSALLGRVTEAADGAALATLIDANDIPALAFSLRRGFALQTPVLRASGRIPREEDLAKMAAGEYRFSAVPIDPRALRYALDGLDRNVRGSARPDDHVWFENFAHGTAFMLAEECVGYAYVWPNGCIGPMVAASNAYAVQFFAFALQSLRRTYDASWCTLIIPGNNVRIAQVAAKSGLIVDRASILASNQSMGDCSRYVGFDRLAF